jgi:hypothetical protein
MSLELTNEQKIVLDLASKTVSEEPFKELLPSDVLKTADWKLVAKETNTQAILLSALEVAQVYKEYIPENLYVLWQDKAFTSLAQNFKVLEWQKELVSLLEKENLKYLIIKGTSASAYYPKPELRLLGDVDFLIDQKDRARVEALLENNGYVNWKQGHECHVVFRKEKAHLEMHFEVAGLPENEHKSYVFVHLSKGGVQPELANLHVSVDNAHVVGKEHSAQN